MKNQTDFQRIINDLTPDEKKALLEATSPEWMKAIKETLNDPTFWQAMIVAFVEGIACGIQDALDDNRRK
jgi:hypothetical protein